MQLNLIHRGTVVASFDTSAMDPDEKQTLLRLRRQRHFDVVRAEPDKLPEIPGYSMMADVVRSQELENRRFYRTGYRQHLIG